jgi:hypothetical protein
MEHIDAEFSDDVTAFSSLSIPDGDVLWGELENLVDYRCLSPINHVDGRCLSPINHVDGRCLSPINHVDSRCLSPINHVDSRCLSPITDVDNRGASCIGPSIATQSLRLIVRNLADPSVSSSSPSSTWRDSSLSSAPSVFSTSPLLPLRPPLSPARLWQPTMKTPSTPACKPRSVDAATDGRKFVCRWPQCGSLWQCKSKLARHMLTHTGLRPFACFCGSTFNQKPALKNHTIGQHVEKGNLPHWCDVVRDGLNGFTYQALIASAAKTVMK